MTLSQENFLEKGELGLSYQTTCSTQLSNIFGVGTGPAMLLLKHGYSGPKSVYINGSIRGEKSQRVAVQRLPSGALETRPRRMNFCRQPSIYVLTGQVTGWNILVDQLKNSKKQARTQVHDIAKSSWS